MHFQPLTESDKREMLAEIGVTSFEDLIKGVPRELRNPKIDVPEALSELEIQTHLKKLAAANATTQDSLSFLGGGAYDHFIPAAVAQIIGRSEFYTAYTPYQPEASQGTLQSIYEYQSLITELTGLDVSNASHYDGATSMADAALLALRHTERTQILVSRSLHPHYLRVLKTYLEGTPYHVREFGFDAQGRFNREEFRALIGPDTAGAIFQSPNFLGVLEDLEGVSDELHAAGALLLMTGHPLSMAVVRSPGEWGADVAAGEGQPLGIPVSYGGPYLGYFSASRSLLRRIPGRLAGMTQDLEGRRAFCLTLQAREQHIRRERAASNICTNQALCALAACVYMTLMGKEGMRELGEINMDRAYYLRERIAKLKGYKVETDVPIFNEFVVTASKPFADIEKKLAAQKIFAGVNLSAFFPEMQNRFLVCATETKTKEDLDRFADALGKI